MGISGTRPPQGSSNSFISLYTGNHSHEPVTKAWKDSAARAPQLKLDAFKELTKGFPPEFSLLPRYGAFKYNMRLASVGPSNLTFAAVDLGKGQDMARITFDHVNKQFFLVNANQASDARGPFDLPEGFDLKKVLLPPADQKVAKGWTPK